MGKGLKNRPLRFCGWPGLTVFKEGGVLIKSALEMLTAAGQMTMSNRLVEHMTVEERKLVLNLDL